ncbi:MAG: hypothetical protein KDA60_01285 [Planctomycetales bacterium]|nr:hypothetical protein [Planctomycetales bacterium]
MSVVLGISAFYHDSAAALVVDGRVVAAAQEERFSRRKHDSRFPRRAVEFCLGEAGKTLADVDHIGFYEKPLRKLERLAETYLAYAPRGYASFRRAIPRWLQNRHTLRQAWQDQLGYKCRSRMTYVEHHEAHAASAFFASPFAEAAILTMDGVGEWTTTSWGVGLDRRIDLHQEMRFPHSLGLLYSAFTHYLGFRVNSGEYKVMGLAPYGKPRYRDLILKHLIDVRDDGSFWLDQRYFQYCSGLTMTSQAFHDLFGGPPRVPESQITDRDMDLASSIQAVTEEVVLRLGTHVRQESQQANLVLAGGVALNGVAAGRLLRDGGFSNVWTQPAAGDAGGALGVALFITHQLLDEPRVSTGPCIPFWGPSFTDDEITKCLNDAGVEFARIENVDELCQTVARLLAEQRVVGWFQGRAEFGPRALGSRSILADPRQLSMRERLNDCVKRREAFRPFAPSVLSERAHDYFELPAVGTPYMTFVSPVASAQRIPVCSSPPPRGLDRRHIAQSTIPAVTHVDGTARVQTVDEIAQPRFHRLLSAFEGITGCPVLVNTSLNVRGEPIACTPQNALDCFRRTDMDVLVLGSCVVVKSVAERQDGPR